MPLTGVHLYAGVACVVAALLMLGGTRTRTVRAAHGVVVATMAVLVVAGHSVPAVVGGALALAATAAVLSRARGREDRACALDVAVCGALVLLMTVPLVLGAAPGAGQHAGHAHGDHRLVLAAQVVVLLGAWAVSRRRLVPGPSLTRVARAAPWAMALGMGAMIVA